MSNRHSRSGFCAFILAASAFLSPIANAACSNASLSGVYAYRLDLTEHGRVICAITGKYKFDGAGGAQEYDAKGEGDCGGGDENGGPYEFRYRIDKSCSGTLIFSKAEFTLFINQDGSFGATKANAQADIEISAVRQGSRGEKPTKNSPRGNRWSSLTALQKEKLSQRWLDAARSVGMWSSMCCRGKEISYACDQYQNELAVLAESCAWGDETLCKTWASASSTHGWCHVTR